MCPRFRCPGKIPGVAWRPSDTGNKCDGKKKKKKCIAVKSARRVYLSSIFSVPRRGAFGVAGPRTLELLPTIHDDYKQPYRTTAVVGLP